MLYDLEIFWVYLQTFFESSIIWHGVMVEQVANWIIITSYAIIVILLVAVVYFTVVGIRKKIGDIKR